MDREVKHCQQIPGISGSPLNGYSANCAPSALTMLSLEWLSHKEFGIDITIPITPLLSLHNRQSPTVFPSLQEFIDWRQLGKINFGEGELPAQFMKPRACVISIWPKQMRMQIGYRGCPECSQGSQF
jgi:hypothetical protein